MEERASLMARMPAGAPPTGAAPVTRPPRVKSGCRCGKKSAQSVVVVMGEMPADGDGDGGCGRRASKSSMRRSLTSSRSANNCKVGITFDAAPAPAPAAARVASFRRGLSLSGRSSASSESSSGLMMAQHEEGRLRRQRQAEGYNKAMEARTASVHLEISRRNIAKDCICVCLCDEGTFGFGNCVCVCVCGAADEGLPSPVGTPTK